MDDNVPTMVISSDAYMGSAYVSSYFTAEGEGLLEPSFLLVAALGKTPSYAQPLKLEESVKAQSMDAYWQQVVNTLVIPGSAFSYYQALILVC